jgi:oxygen-dependent protoporphyrinogen oxidase
MIPRREQRSIDAVTVTSAKLLARSHDGYALVRVFFGGGKSELLDLSNENLLKVIIREMESLLNIYEDPLGYEIFRWKEGFPQATVGHLDRMRGIEKNLPEGIFLAGSSYHGVAVPDCLRSANKAARSASDFLATVLPIKP